ncbi:hypothetical protein RCG23_19145 [Neobacillus sp. PS3-34]|uniref:hypothetical protein n=1 Tax=Neobacillus sp. PS3-34 TaxID=3070678 RepID=UPI0027E081AF|nr:hypothetical protein [Neobacillus sp. PS3-34]WML47510.1 hypothetical protein RCG23_19145 [Neobacillus sp. PS3-34]
MNSRGVRAFALGIFFTACVIGSYYFNINKVETIPSAKKQLEDKGYIVLSPNEYKMLKNTGNQKNRQTASAKKLSLIKKLQLPLLSLLQSQVLRIRRFIPFSLKLKQE